MVEKKKDTRIYIVFGETGEHQERETWTVLAFYMKEEAQRHCEAAEKEAKKIQEKIKAARSLFDFDEIDRKNLFDPVNERWPNSETGINYYIEEVDLREE